MHKVTILIYDLRFIFIEQFQRYCFELIKKKVYSLSAGTGQVDGPVGGLSTLIICALDIKAMISKPKKM